MPLNYRGRVKEGSIPSLSEMIGVVLKWFDSTVQIPNLGPLVQLAEPSAHNGKVLSSNLGRPTILDMRPVLTSVF